MIGEGLDQNQRETWENQSKKMRGEKNPDQRARLTKSNKRKLVGWGSEEKWQENLEKVEMNRLRSLQKQDLNSR